ncbi:monofunctional biosynthetic peptidoglycan transglycosylase [Pikeienuella piscinae]|uniref:Biosynthetic peptidoglycan transglycosylase n=1 Tax=Pikeienuella piscinae TaxID=2748098 RepID=A0A7L5BWL2_9RHOB|nr:monofunctional biosynthetic peptidoglycan transglycosylase [Pikeienuella piscinae]QIE55543.1 monofunctional biosynthetic peptidoglycan transglycosylase [Pikeienuella piscinae]
MKRARRLFRALARRVMRLLVTAALVASLWVVAYRWIDPPVTYLIASEWLRLGDVSRDWRDLDEISPDMARAAMGGEDAKFCAHYGFDFKSIRMALADERRRRGASTISQQVAKNAFLWPGANWLRKGLEAGFTVLIELSWPKARIMEVYLNIAEMGPGVFGAEAAAQHWFGKPASKLSLREAARIAAILPNPRERNAARPSAYVGHRAGAIADGADTLRAEGRADCVSP